MIERMSPGDQLAEREKAMYAADAQRSQAGSISTPMRRATIAEQLRDQAKTLECEANGLLAIARHLSPAIEQDSQAVAAFRSLLQRPFR